MTTVNIASIKRIIQKVLSEFIYAKTERRPMIMPVVMLVNE